MGTNNSNGFRPINLNGINLGGGNGGKKNSWITIVIVIILMIIFFYGDDEETVVTENNTNTNTNSYTQNTTNQNEYDDSSSSFLDLLFGTGSVGTNSNQDYSAYEDKTIKNASSDKYTLMVYMCGSNLESDGGYASSDIEEMLKSTMADEINLLVYTGGARRWYDFGISNKTNQIYKVENHKLNLVQDNLGLENMTNSNTLAGFLKFCKDNYPAKKYGLIMWDHGGGAVSGFGLDQNASRNDSLTIDEIKTAVSTFGQKLEFIGFDACLMANVETAYALKDSANYFIASEETEPGTGWDYIKLINGLSRNTSQTGDTTGRTIVDSFIASNSSFRNPDATLSVVNLRKMDNVYSKLVDFMKEVKSTNFDKNKYNTFSRTVVNSKAFGEGEVDAIDLVHFANNMRLKSSDSLVTAVKDAVVYNKTNQYVENSNGLSIYIPYSNISWFDSMLSIYRKIGIGSEYSNVLTQYVRAISGGRRSSYKVNNVTYSRAMTDYKSASWYDESFEKELENYYKSTTLDATRLEVEDKGDYFELNLSDSDWDLISKVESVVWYDDGKGYIDMGDDSLFKLNFKRSLKIEFDGQWLAINGDNVYYQVIERTDNYEKGRVPAVINDERVNMVLYFDKENPDGIVLGYEPDYVGLNQTLYERGLRNIKKGDKIDFVAPYYKHNSSSMDDEYYINDTLIVGDEGLKISYEPLGDGECLVFYKITDIYNNIYYTEPVIFE